MAMHSDAFIDLDRTFSKIPLDADASDDVELSGRHSRRGELHWPDLLTHNRVISTAMIETQLSAIWEMSCFLARPSCLSNVGLLVGV